MGRGGFSGAEIAFVMIDGISLYKRGQFSL